MTPSKKPECDCDSMEVTLFNRGWNAAIDAATPSAQPSPVQPVAREELTNSQIMASVGRCSAGISESRPLRQQWDQVCDLIRYVMRERGYTTPHAAQPAPNMTYSIDADSCGIRKRAADAIIGALALGAQDSSPPPEGHWLQQFWDIGRAEASKAIPPAAPVQPVAYRVKWPTFGGGHKWIMAPQPTMVDAGFVNEALYTSPPAQLAPAPLTDWVSVEDRLPGYGGYYLVTVDTDEGPHVDVLMYNDTRKHWEHEGEPTYCHSYLFSPTHWAARPEAARGTTKGQP